VQWAGQRQGLARWNYTNGAGPSSLQCSAVQCSAVQCSAVGTGGGEGVEVIPDLSPKPNCAHGGLKG
jgi:hypothetical protein